MFRSKVTCVTLSTLVLTLLAVREVASQCRITDDVCEFWLHIEHKMTMMHNRDAVYAYNGKLYKYDVPESQTNVTTPIDPNDVIIADGWEGQRLVVVANSSMPGPPIEVYEGQTVVVHVKNHMRANGVTVHWHGLHQVGTPWMDGVSSVTQCAIAPGAAFTYQFKAKPKGTFWYHSHIGSQLGMGLLGAFIIKEKKAKILDEHIVMLQDWNHSWDADISHMRMEYGSFDNRVRYPTTDSLEGGHFSNYLFHSGLINGRGRFYGETQQHYAQTPLTVYEVDQNTNYRFRVIGAGILYPFRVSVDGHRFKVVASDGYELQPVEVESFIINPGERYDFILEADQAVDNYWLRAETLEIDVINHVALAIVRYRGAPEVDPIQRGRGCTPTEKCLVINCPFMYYPEGDNTECMIVSELRALFLDEAPDDDVEDIFLNFAFPGTTKTPGSTNGAQFTAPAAPPLTQPEDFDTRCGAEHDCGEQKVCHCVLSVDLQHGKTYQFVMTNLGTGKGWPHPIHMHGHSFHVVKMGYPSYNQTTGKILADNPDIDCRGNVSADKSFCNAPAWANGSWSGNNVPDLKLTWGPRKDTIMVPTGGYTVVRIKADNPGTWFMHCHIELHNLDGMALILNESFSTQPPPPKDFPKCGHYEYSGLTDISSTDRNVMKEKIDDDNDCTDNKVFWGVVAGLIALAVLQFIVIFCMIRRQTIGQTQKKKLGAHTNEAYVAN